LKGRGINIAGSNANANGNGKEGFALKVFGRSTRETNCDCDRSMEASLLQTVYLQNDNEVLTALNATTKGTWMEQLNPVLNPPKPSESKTRTQREQLKVEITKAKLRVEESRKTDKANKETKDKTSERTEKLVARVKELERDLAKLPDDKPAPPPAAPADLPVLVREAYLRTLSRPPSAAELDRSMQFIANANTPSNGMRDLLWALLNTKEFIVNH
jgi:hypothetical protein